MTAPPRTRWDWRRPLRVVLIGAPALWLLFIVVHLVGSGRVWWWRPADLLPPFIYVFVPPVLALAAYRCRHSRRPAAILSAGALVIGAGLAGINLGGPLRPATAAPADALKVVSWNTSYWHDPGEEDAFYGLLRAQNADVYLLQEYLHYPDDQPERVDELATIQARMPGYNVAVAGELVTLSRYPIIRQLGIQPSGVTVPADTDFPDFWRFKALRTDLVIDSRPLSVYNVHLPTPLWIGGPSPLQGEFWSTIRRLHNDRVPHLEALARDVDERLFPALAAGDFNTTPAMGERDRFPDGLRDAAAASGALYPATWPVGDTPFPLWWRLDWTLVSPELSVHDYEFRDPAGMSDHKLQFVTVSL